MRTYQQRKQADYEFDIPVYGEHLEEARIHDRLTIGARAIREQYPCVTPDDYMLLAHWARTRDTVAKLLAEVAYSEANELRRSNRTRDVELELDNGPDDRD